METGEIAMKLFSVTADCQWLTKELKECCNELCLRCGNYHESYAGACDGCRFRHGGEWSDDLDE